MRFVTDIKKNATDYVKHPIFEMGAQTLMEKKRLAEDLVRCAWELATDQDEVHLSEALEYLDKAISYDPEHEYVWYWKGFALSRLKKWSEALECFEKSIVIDNGFSESWYLKGDCLLALDKTLDSIEAFQNALLNYSDPDPRSRSLTYETFRKLFVLSDVAGWENREQSRRLYQRRMVVLTIRALATSYARLFFFNRSCDLLQKAQKMLEELGLPVPENMKKDYDDAKLMNETMRNLGTGLELRFPQGFPSPNIGFSKENPELHRALMLALACKYEEAFAVFRNNEKFKSDRSLQLLFATLLLDSVPYRNGEALARQGISVEIRKQRLQEAEQILCRLLEEKKVRPDSETLSIVNTALNNKAAAMIHLADYSSTWEDVLRRHREAQNIFKNLNQMDKSLKSPKTNQMELTFVLRVLEQEPKRNPDFLKEFIKTGIGLTEMRDLLLVTRGNEVRIEILEEIKKKTKDQNIRSQIQLQIENLRKGTKQPRTPTEISPSRRSRFSFFRKRK